MEFEGRSRISLQLSLTPMIDVVLLLLIFFMLTSTYLVAEAIDLELPFSNSSRAVQEHDVVVVLALDGTVTVSGQAVARDQLVDHLESVIVSPLEQMITLKTEAEENVQDMISVMDDIRAAGGQRVLIATQGAQPPSSDSEE